ARFSEPAAPVWPYVTVSRTPSEADDTVARALGKLQRPEQQRLALFIEAFLRFVFVVPPRVTLAALLVQPLGEPGDAVVGAPLHDTSDGRGEQRRREADESDHDRDRRARVLSCHHEAHRERLSRHREETVKTFRSMVVARLRSAAAESGRYADVNVPV